VSESSVIIPAYGHCLHLPALLNGNSIALALLLLHAVILFQAIFAGLKKS
jgi:hypothetical protein